MAATIRWVVICVGLFFVVLSVFVLLWVLKMIQGDYEKPEVKTVHKTVEKHDHHGHYHRYTLEANDLGWRPSPQLRPKGDLLAQKDQVNP